MKFNEIGSYIKLMNSTIPELSFFCSKADMVAMTDSDGNPTDKMLSEKLTDVDKNITSLDKKIDDKGLDKKTLNLINGIADILKSEEQNDEYSNIYILGETSLYGVPNKPKAITIDTSSFSISAVDTVFKKGDLFYLSKQCTLSYPPPSTAKVTIQKGWYKVNFNPTYDGVNPSVVINTDTDTGKTTKYCTVFSSFYEPDGYVEPTYLCDKDDYNKTINNIISNLEAEGSIFINNNSVVELKDAPDIIKKSYMYKGETDYWYPGFMDG